MSTEEINHLKATKTYQQIPFQRFFSSTEWLDGSVNPSGFKTSSSQLINMTNISCVFPIKWLDGCVNPSGFAQQS